MMPQQVTNSRQLGVAVRGVHEEQDDPIGRVFQTHDQFAEVFVFGQEYPLLVGRQLQHRLVSRTRSNLLDVQNVHAAVTQAIHQQSITTFIRDELHRASPDATTMSSFAR